MSASLVSIELYFQRVDGRTGIGEEERGKFKMGKPRSGRLKGKRKEKYIPYTKPHLPKGWLQLSCGFCEYLLANSSRMLFSS